MKIFTADGADGADQEENDLTPRRKEREGEYD